MKKIVLILFLFASFSLHAQHKPFQFGFKGGVNLGWFKSDLDNFNNDGTQFGGSWGFVADIFMMESYAFTTGFDVLYLNAEGNIADSIKIEETAMYVDGQSYHKIKSKYIQIPIVFTMKTNTIKEKLRIYGQIGYGLGILLQAKEDYKFVENNGTANNQEEKGKSYDGLSATRSSLILGIGVEVPLHKSTYLRTGFKFDNCFVDIAKSDEIKIRSNFVELNLAVIF